LVEARKNVVSTVDESQREYFALNDLNHWPNDLVSN
jgi:hypothetical protein